MDEASIPAGTPEAKTSIMTWGLATAVVTVLLYFFVDLPAVQVFAPYHHMEPGLTHFALVTLRQYGQGYFALASVVAMLVFDRRRKRDVASLVIAILAMAAVVNLLKLLTGRARPDEFLLGSPEWKVFGGFVDKEYRSFPSAHAASAFAFSVAMSMIYRKWWWAFLALAALCAMSRVVNIQHWPSDITVGAGLGAWIGYGAFNWRWAKALAAKFAP